MPKDEKFRKGSSEEEYFYNLNKELIDRFREKLQEERKSSEDLAAKQLHWMKCPKCGHNLQKDTIEGVEIDQCNSCQGVFIDRGEVDLIMQTEGHTSILSVVHDLMNVRKKGA